ncbi:peptidoglycan DD-metalloendopeptidase family protein [Actinoplanes sp. NPDC049265]|uniref:peptidoglycan DD-metalloendopeptidase family protein n=1 Tax=Actinoplanes sp. NPDC049265 TaxID=3363902 RepID=UPI003713FA83
MQHRAATAVDSHSDDAGLRAYLDLLASTEPLPAPPTDAELAYRALLASDTALTSASPSTPADPAARAYLGLLASDAPLTSASPSTPADPAARAYLGLLASDTPLTPAGLLPATATTRVPAFNRNTLVATALAVGVGVSGLGVGVAAAASPSRADSIPVAAAVQHRPAAEQPAVDPTADLPGTVAHNLVERDMATRDPVTLTEDMPSDAPQRSSAVALHKPKPQPKPATATATAVAWVNPLPEARVTSCFGQRWGRLHAGVDLAAPNGTPIRAAGAGVVVAAGAESGYGNAVLIDHGNGFLTHYGHMSAITVTVGRRVLPGTQIGNEGSTGHSTGPHLHFEVHEGHYKNPIEPTTWMRAHNVLIPGCTTTAPADDH